MMNFFKNNYYRISSRKYYILSSVIMTMLSIFLAVFISSKAQVKGNIAVVSQKSYIVFNSNYMKFINVSKKPAEYELMLGKYDGIIIDKGEGSFQVETLRNDDFKRMLEAIVNNSKGDISLNKDSRGIGTNIIGFLMMFILIQSMLYIFLLAEDMELKQIERIVAAPVSLIKYLLAHFIFIFILIFMPAIVILVVMKIFNFNIGFSILQYTVFLTFLCGGGIAFSMFINALVKSADKANMMGSSIILLTTILSGSFYSFDKGNAVLEKAIWVLPQKNYLSFIQGIENGKDFYNGLPQLSYFLLIAFSFFIISTIKIKKDYIQKKG